MHNTALGSADAARALQNNSKAQRKSLAILGLEGTVATLGIEEFRREKEADDLFSIIAELGVVLRGEHSNLYFNLKL